MARRPSGSETRKRTFLMTVRFNRQEAEAARKLADEAGMSVGSLLRLALFDAPPPSRPDDLKQV